MVIIDCLLDSSFDVLASDLAGHARIDRTNLARHLGQGDGLQRKVAELESNLRLQNDGCFNQITQLIQLGSKDSGRDPVVANSQIQLNAGRVGGVSDLTITIEGCDRVQEALHQTRTVLVCSLKRCKCPSRIHMDLR